MAAKSLINLELLDDDSIRVSSDLSRLDMGTTTKDEFVAAMLSYVPSFCRAEKSMDAKTFYLTGIVLTIFLASACAISYNGDDSAELFNNLYKSYRKEYLEKQKNNTRL